MPAAATRFDVAILGGGPAGLATAIALKRHAPAHSVAVLARPPAPREKVGETLPPGARAVLASLGLWETFAADGHRTTHASRAAWGSDEPYDNEFILHPDQRGWLLDRPRFDARLVEEARALGVVVWEEAGSFECELIAPSSTDAPAWRIRATHPSAAAWGGMGVPPMFRLRSGGTPDRHGRDARATAESPASFPPHSTLTARFLVDATGRAALLAERQGATRIADDRLVAISRVFHDVADTFAKDPSPLVDACEGGWWFSAPLPARRAVATLFTDADLARETRARDDAGWEALLEKVPHTRRRLLGARFEESPRLRPADSVILDRLAGDDAAGGAWLAVGDAASTFDPLSSHGIVKALRQATFAAYAIADHLRGDGAALEKYAAVLRREFADFLSAKRDFYREENRWPFSPFWRRRHGRVWLSPDAELERTAPRPGLPAALHLSPAGQARLWQACDRRRPSQEVVARFATEAGPAEAPGLQVILALQHLVEEGALIRHA